MELLPDPPEPCRRRSEFHHRFVALHPASALDGPKSFVLAALRALHPVGELTTARLHKETAQHPDAFFTKPLTVPAPSGMTYRRAIGSLRPTGGCLLYAPAAGRQIKLK